MAQPSIKRIGVVVKPHQPDALQTLCRLSEWLSQHDIKLVGGPEIERERIELSHVASDEQWRGEQAPEADVGVLFVRGEARGVEISPADFSDDEHVRVVPMAGAGERRGFVLIESNAGQAAPGIGDVARGAPGIAADRGAPFRDV